MNDHRTGCPSRHRYVTGACRCAGCRRANRDYQRDWARSRRRDDGVPRMVPAAEVRDELTRLEQLGWSRRALAACVGVSRSTLDAVASGATASTRRGLAEALAALGAPHRGVSAATARGALAALAEAGYRPDEVARATGLGGRDGRVQVRGREVSARTWSALRSLLVALGAEVSADGQVLSAPLPAAAARQLPGVLAGPGTRRTPGS